MKGNFSIGIFDSGVGGLTVFKKIICSVCCKNIIYLGDTAHLPYGNKSTSTVKKLSLKNTLFLINKNVDLIIIACNTSSSIALEYLRKFFKIPILGVIESQIKKALKLTRNKRIGVIGTPSTVKSKAYQEKLISMDSSLKIFTQACPLFVPLVEEGLTRGKIVRLIIEKYLESLRQKNIDVLILACTHYPLLKKEIQEFMGKKVKLVDASLSIVEDLKEMFGKLSLNKPSKYTPRYEIFITDDLEGFREKSKIIMGRPLNNIKLVNTDV